MLVKSIIIEFISVKLFMSCSLFLPFYLSTSSTSLIQTLDLNIKYYHRKEDSVLKKNIKYYHWKEGRKRLGFFPLLLVAAAARTLQSCPTLCNPIDCCPPGSSVPGILKARTLEWVAISFTSAWKGKGKWKWSLVWLVATPWTAAYQAPPSMGFSRQEYWSGLVLPVSFVKLNRPFNANKYVNIYH